MSLLDLTAVELAKSIKEGKTTAVEAMQAVIDQIEKYEQDYNCYVTFDTGKTCDIGSTPVVSSSFSLSI